VHFDAGETRIGDIVTVHVDAIQTNSLSATLAGKAA
jgi:hypothetical protein